MAPYSGVTIIYVARALRVVETFDVPDPWRGGKQTPFALVEYVMMREAAGNAIDDPKRERRFGLRAHADGSERMLPDALTHLWRRGQLPALALPERLYLLEHILRASDYEPVLENKQWRFGRRLFLLVFGVPLAAACAAFPILLWASPQPYGQALQILGYLLAAAGTIFVVDRAFFGRLLKRRRDQMRSALRPQ